MHLGIDFLHMSMDFGRQVGRQNGPKIDPKRHWKKDSKKKRFFNGFGRFLGGEHHARAMAGRGLSDPLKTKHHWNWARAWAGTGTSTRYMYKYRYKYKYRYRGKWAG